MDLQKVGVLNRKELKYKGYRGRSTDERSKSGLNKSIGIHKSIYPLRDIAFTFPSV